MPTTVRIETLRRGEDEYKFLDGGCFTSKADAKKLIDAAFSLLSDHPSYEGAKISIEIDNGA